ncbi:LysR substrate-binding domain-containing protein, partial [Vibrio alginolyticus]
KMSMYWVASADHYVHKRSGKFDEAAREKYRIIAIADTAREQPALSINIIQKQPRLTVTNFTAKVEALTAGLGIGTLPSQIAQPLIDSGVLKRIEGTEEQPMDIILAWRRNTMGEAKSWCIQYLKKNWKLK